jgi:hypothetical protein
MAWFFVSPFLLSVPHNPQWTTYSNAGCSVQLPPGWTASPDPRKGWLHLMGTQGEDVVIWPVFIPEEAAIQDIRTAQSILMKLAAACPYHASWEAPQAAGPRALRAFGKSQNMRAVSVFTWTASSRGTAAYFYLAAAREEQFRQKQDDLAKILQSFRLVGTAGKASPGNLKFVSFRDSREGSFTVDVPAGWKTAGGLFRVSPFVNRIAVETDSPDGQTRVMLGDAELPSSFQEYLPGTPAWAVQPVGSNILGNIVYPYMTGALFCQYYIQSRIQPFCSELQVTGVEDNPLVEKPAPMPMTASTQFTEGSVNYSCREQGQPRVGACAARTTRSIPPPQIQSPMLQWRVDLLMGYLAPPESSKQAEMIMNRMKDSFQVDTQWGMREIQAVGDRSRIISETSRDIAQMVESSQRYRDAVDDRIARLRSNATLGVTDVMDPATGRHMTVDSGSGYYWVDPRGMILGTNVDTSPGVDFRRLLELPLR